jgi:hypothetical protein
MIPASMLSLVLGAMCTIGCVATEPAMPLQIAAAEMPAAGDCRIWYPERAPDEQPKPGPCRLIGEVPPGATLVVGPTQAIMAP